ncbi:hypothetical protein FRC12_005003 [Ceratobasidium sp. 428]|nr:hypothetical protein FRC12_005003 [Ceratobasidium sp. 428]
MLRPIYQDVLNVISRLNFSTSPSDSLAKLRKYKFTWVEIAEYVFLAALATLWLVLVPITPFLLKLMVPPLIVALLVTPVTGQFFIPAAPVLIWAILCVIHFTAPFIVAAALWLWRPNAGKGNNEALKL